METDIDIFMGLAGIAGVFVGFGALISISADSEMREGQLIQIRGVVSIGLLVIVAALVPVALASYGMPERSVWLVSSLAFLVMLWGAGIYGLRRPEHQAQLRQNTRSQSLFFWLALELPIHVVVILTVIGTSPDLDPAFYTTALVLHLLEGAFVLTQLVYAQVGTSTG